MSNIEYKLINFAYVFAKFFLILFWMYLTWLIVCGGEITITIGKSGMTIGFEGIYLSVKKIILNLIK